MHQSSLSDVTRLNHWRQPNLDNKDVDHVLVRGRKRRRLIDFVLSAVVANIASHLGVI